MDTRNKLRNILSSGLVNSVYPEYLLKNFNISKEEGLKICNEFHDEGLLSPMYEVRCPTCVKQLGVFETLNGASNMSECIYCNNTFNNFEDLLENISVYFQVSSKES